VLEEQATGVPLIAGNRVTAAVRRPGHDARDDGRGARRHHLDQPGNLYLRPGPIGNEFAELLIEKQRQGVTVNVMVDASARSARRPPSSTACARPASAC
jgi:cardiolipin synthase